MSEMGKNEFDWVGWNELRWVGLRWIELEWIQMS